MNENYKMLREMENRMRKPIYTRYTRKVKQNEREVRKVRS